jgi:hypothetical protein
VGGDDQSATVLKSIVPPRNRELRKSGPKSFFARHGFGYTTTYERRYPPRAILGTAYELATGQRLASGDFEGGKSGAVRVSAGVLQLTVGYDLVSLRG